MDFAFSKPDFKAGLRAAGSMMTGNACVACPWLRLTLKPRKKASLNQRTTAFNSSPQCASHRVRNAPKVSFAYLHLPKPESHTPVGFVLDELQLRNQGLDGRRLRWNEIHIDAPRDKARHAVRGHVVFINLTSANEPQSGEGLQGRTFGVRLARRVINQAIARFHALQRRLLAVVHLRKTTRHTAQHMRAADHTNPMIHNKNPFTNHSS